MKSKKKVGLVKRIAAGVCAVMLAVGCMGVNDLFYAFSSTGYSPYVYPLLFNGYEYYDLEESYAPPLKCDIPYDLIDEYGGYYVCMVNANNPERLRLYISNFPLQIVKDTTFLYVRPTLYSSAILSELGLENIPLTKVLLTSSDGGENWEFKVCGVDSTYEYGSNDSWTSYKMISSDDYVWDWKLLETNHFVMNRQPGFKTDGEGYYYYFWEPFSCRFDAEYNSSLGYLQNISLKELYLKGGDVAYDPETCKKIWSFGNASTSDLDISDGSYTIRHYQQITVRESSPTPVVKEYEKILMGEYPVSNGSFSYMAKDSLSRLETESGFEPLGFWDTSILKRYTSIVNYFQLVRTNEDGSVEYGGLVKVDLRGAPGQNDFSSYEYGATTYTYEGEVDTNGYVDRDVPIVQAIAYDYEDAEDKADEELGENSDGSSSSGGDLIDQIDDIVSSVMAIPEIFARMFSFLPDWCLNFFGISVALAGAVILWKAFT